MSQATPVTYPVQVYTTTARWRGDLILASSRRISDFLNDAANAFIPLQRVTLETGPHGAHQTALDAMAVQKCSVIVVIPRGDAGRTNGNNCERVLKIPHRVLIYAPPFALEGDLHLARGVYLMDALNVLRQDFLPLTDVMLWRTDGRAPLAEGLPFVAVNRYWIAALHPTFPRAEKNQPQLERLCVPAFA